MMKKRKSQIIASHKRIFDGIFGGIFGGINGTVSEFLGTRKF
jgi:hypothetical protein